MTKAHPNPSPAEGPTPFADWLLSHAEYLGWQPDHAGGGFELWNLKKALAGYPVNSTVSRQTLARIHAGSLSAALAGHHGRMRIEGSPKDFSAVESPRLPP